MRKTGAATIAAALTFGSTTALAQKAEFGSQGTAAFSADRLFGFYAATEELEFPAPVGDVETDYSHFGFGWQGLIHGTPYSVPRFAFDYFIIDGLNIGGSIGYANIEVDPEGPPEGDRSAFIFAPRVGYVWMFSDVIGFWLRGGFTFHSMEDDTGFVDDFEESAFALTIDPVFPIFPTDHFGFVVGPVIDFSVTGERDVGPPLNDVDLNYRSFGITAGLIGYL